MSEQRMTGQIESHEKYGYSVIRAQNGERYFVHGKEHSAIVAINIGATITFQSKQLHKGTYEKIACDIEFDGRRLILSSTSDDILVRINKSLGTRRGKSSAQKILRRSNWQEFEKIVNNHKIECLYHFTDVANIPSIIKHGGLYSWWACQQRKIPIAKPGGNSTSRHLDEKEKLHDFVRLSFNDNHPMLYRTLHDGRIEKPVWLKINPRVIYWKSTRFSDINATSNGANVGNGIEDFQKVRLDIATQPYYNNETMHHYQAEVLVETHIPLKYILNIK